MTTRILFLLYGTFALVTLLFGQNRWENIEEFSEGDVICDVVRGLDHQVVAVGFGMVLTSEDGGNSWEQVFSLPPFENWQLLKVAYGEGRFVVSDGFGLFSSPDGKTWTKVSNQSAIQSVFYLNGRFIGLSGREFYVISEDGIDWETLSRENGKEIQTHLVFGNNKYLIEDYSQIGYSQNGREWHWYDKPEKMRGNWRLYFDGISKFFYFRNAFWKFGTSSCFRSEDGLSWTEFSIDQDFIPLSIVEFNGTLVAATENSIYISEDGYNWIPISKGLDSLKGLYSDQANHTLYVFGGVDGWKYSRPSYRTHNQLFEQYQDIDKIRIPKIPIGDNSSFQSLAVHSSGLYADAGDLPLCVSIDGLDWNFVEAVDSEQGVAFLGSQDDRLYVQWTNQQFAISDDGISWSYAENPPSGKLYDVHEAAGVLVGVGAVEFRAPFSSAALFSEPVNEFESSLLATFIHDTGAIYVCQDGTNWEQIQIGAPTGPIREIAYGNNIFLAVGGTNYVDFYGSSPIHHAFRSVDGINWEAIDPDIDSGYFRSIVFFNGAFYVADGSSTLLKSEEGEHWQSVHVEGVEVAQLYVDQMGMLIAVGSNAFIAGSPDGEVWYTKQIPTTSTRLVGDHPTFCEINGYYHLGGARGFRLRSPNNGFWQAHQASDSWSSWPEFGWFWEDAYGGVNHASLGWIFMEPLDLVQGDFYWYTPSWGWLWMRNDWLPWHYRMEDDVWLYQSESTGWFYNLTSATWERIGARH